MCIFNVLELKRCYFTLEKELEAYITLKTLAAQKTIKNNRSEIRLYLMCLLKSNIWVNDCGTLEKQDPGIRGFKDFYLVNKR